GARPRRARRRGARRGPWRTRPGPGPRPARRRRGRAIAPRGAGSGGRRRRRRCPARRRSGPGGRRSARRDRPRRRVRPARRWPEIQLRAERDLTRAGSLTRGGIESAPPVTSRARVRWRLLSAALLLALAAVMLATVRDYGMTGDEGVQHRYARRLLRWYATRG